MLYLQDQQFNNILVDFPIASILVTPIPNIPSDFLPEEDKTYKL